MLKVFTKKIDICNSLSKLHFRFFSTALEETELKSRGIIKKSLRGKNRIKYDLKKGDLIHNFELIKIDNYKDFSISAYTLKHVMTGSVFLHLDTADLLNSFAIILKSSNNSDNGIASVIERLVLCGSKQYPVRDPFTHISKRTLNNYMSTWTGPDYVCFPFATINPTDFNSLRSFYLNSVFNPLLTQIDFRNEAWRFELNEDELLLKGNTIEASKIFWQTREKIFLENLKCKLFTNNYQFSNCGKPEKIMDLNYNDVIDYYNKFYNPSNCKIYSYGDLDFRESLKSLDEFFQTKIKENNTLVLQNNYEFSKKSEVAKTYTINAPPEINGINENKTCKFALTFLCQDILEDEYKNIMMNILAYILFETPFSPLYKLLLESGVSSAYCPGYGFDLSTREGTFTIGVDNIYENSLGKLETDIFSKLSELHDKGINQDLIEIALNQIEINSKMPKNDFGLTLLNNIITTYINNDDILNKSFGLGYLNVSENISKIRLAVRKKMKPFEKLIKQFFLQNPNYIRLIMKSDNNFITDYYENEKKLLSILHKRLSVEEKKKINLENENLQKELAIPQNIDILPILQLHEIPLESLRTNIEEEEIMGVKTNWVFEKINDITFFRIKINLSSIPSNLLKYLDLFSLIFTKIGSKTLSSDFINQIISKNTMNFTVSIESVNDFYEVNKRKDFMLITLSFLDQNLEETLNIFNELMTFPNFFDLTNLSELLNFFASERINDFSKNVLDYGIGYSASRLNNVCKHNERLLKTRFLCELSSKLLKHLDIKVYLEDIARNLDNLFDYLIRKKNIEFIVHCDIENKMNVKRRLDLLVSDMKLQRKNFLIDIPSVTVDNNSYFEQKYFKNYITIPSYKNYVIETIEIPLFSHPDIPFLRVFAELAKAYLKEEIVDYGGAYSAGCHINWNRYLSFYTFKDPHTLQSFEGFEKACSLVLNGKFSESELHSAKLAIFSKIDQNIEIYNKGMNYLLYGLNDDLWGNYKGQILNATKQNIIDVATKYPLLKMSKGETSQIIFGSKDNKLEDLISRGWKIERFAQELSLSSEIYQQNNENEEKIYSNI